MAEQKQNSEFLGGGPKFNTVGKDNRPSPGMEDPVVVPHRAGYWVRVAGIVLVVAMLAGLLFYLNDSGFGKTTKTPTQVTSPDAKPPPTTLDR